MSSISDEFYCSLLFYEFYFMLLELVFIDCMCKSLKVFKVVR